MKEGEEEENNNKEGKKGRQRKGENRGCTAVKPQKAPLNRPYISRSDHTGYLCVVD